MFTRRFAPLFLFVLLGANAALADPPLGIGEPRAPEPFTLEQRLLDAARRGDSATALRALDKGAPIGAKDDVGRSALLLAARDAGSLELVKALHARGAGVDEPDATGRAALSWAAAEGRLELVRWLAAQGAELDRADVDRRTPLFHAAAGGHLEVARLLLDRGAKANAPDRFGDTPLMVACIRGKDAMAELLLARGADPTLRNQEGKTAADRSPPSATHCRETRHAVSRPLAWAAAGGVLFFLGYAGFGIWPLALLAWAALWQGLESARERGFARAALLGFVFGQVAHAGGYPWLLRLVDVFLGGDRALGAALWLAHSVWFAASYALYAALYTAARVRGWPVTAAGVLPLVAVEWLFPQLFPVHLGDAFVDRTRFVQIADLGGPLLVSALAVLVSAGLFETARWLARARSLPVASWLVTLAALAAAAGYGSFRLAALERAEADAPALRVGLVQANFGVLEKRRDPSEVHRRHLEQTRELLADGPLDLVVWPETVYSRGIAGPFPVAGDLIRGDLAVPLLFGAATVRTEDGLRRVYNSALLIQADGMIREAYDKNLLVPIAEQLPLTDALSRLFPHAQHFGAASETPPLVLDAIRISTPICYEAAVPSFVRRMARSARPQLFVMLANDAWFGDSHEPWIHLAVARMRAIEHHRYVVRAANSGLSAFVDPAGRLLARSELLARQNLRGTVHPLEGETLYARIGDWPGWLATVSLLGLFLRDRARRPRKEPRA